MASPSITKSSVAKRLDFSSPAKVREPSHADSRPLKKIENSHCETIVKVTLVAFAVILIGAGIVLAGGWLESYLPEMLTVSSVRIYVSWGLMTLGLCLGVSTIAASIKEDVAIRPAKPLPKRTQEPEVVTPRKLDSSEFSDEESDSIPDSPTKNSPPPLPKTPQKVIEVRKEELTVAKVKTPMSILRDRTKNPPRDPQTPSRRVTWEKSESDELIAKLEAKAKQVEEVNFGDVGSPEINGVLESFKNFKVEWLSDDLPKNQYYFEELDDGTLILAIADPKLKGSPLNQLYKIDERFISPMKSRFGIDTLKMIPKNRVVLTNVNDDFHRYIGNPPANCNIFILIPICGGSAYIAVYAGYDNVDKYNNSGSFVTSDEFFWKTDPFLCDATSFFDLQMGSRTFLAIEPKDK